MIIVPTEKRFDWKHTPVALFAIVLLNILIFFFYQSGDEEKYIQAFDKYNSLNLIKDEWPAFQAFVGQKNDPNLDVILDYYNQGYAEEAASGILFNLEFTQFLNKYAHRYIEGDSYSNWKTKRKSVNDIIDSTSSFNFGLVPSNASPLAYITYQFLHGDLMHLVGNLFFLILCGFAVEAIVGHRRFLAFYLLGGIAGGLLHSFLNQKSAIPLVGASGSISAVMAMYLAVFRLKRIEFFYWFFVFVGYIRLPALTILPIYIGKEIFSYFSDQSSNVAFMAHTGGFVGGAVLIALNQMISPKSFNEEYIEEDSENDPIREKMTKYFEQVEKFRFDQARKTLEEVIEQDGLNFERLL
ncbi:MAG: rhomboid family intramembrane serine protease, partial [Kangiellaceae bacterium]|nr:rhomboid family intramembrane serine protease [Kangiellaceae bacterium]